MGFTFNKSYQLFIECHTFYFQLLFQVQYNESYIHLA